MTKWFIPKEHFKNKETNVKKGDKPYQYICYDYQSISTLLVIN